MHSFERDLTEVINRSEEIRVIVYSSIGDVGMKERAKFLEADAHITKLNLEELLETAIRFLVEKKNPSLQYAGKKG